MGSNQPKTVIGIDLGTTYSCVAVFRNNRVEVIANSQGNRTTPSVVAFTPTERVFGEAAKSQGGNNASNTIFDAKRLIGRQLSDNTVQRDVKLWPFKVDADDNGKPTYSVQYKGEHKSYTPEEISAMVLVSMKETAEAFLNCKVSDAVITCPAYFNDAQRQATKDAGRIAGLNVLRILNEPTAAAIAYGLENKTNQAQKVLIFDLGGGTFDVSLLNIEDGFYKVLATAGDTHLGGEDFDNRLVEYFVGEFKRIHQKDITKNPKAMHRLRTHCEQSKRILSAALKTRIEIESLFEGIDFNCELTRAKFEELNNDLFVSCMEPVRKVLADAHIDKSEVNEIVLVGGSSRIPRIQQLVKDFFNKEPNRTINPDEAVAYGAAVQAAVLGGDQSDGITDLLLLNVTPLTLSIKIKDGTVVPVVPRNTSVPCKKSHGFETADDNQTSCEFSVYEGERVMHTDNNLLGSFTIRELPAKPKGQVQFDVTFDIDANGINTVTSVCRNTGQSGRIIIDNNRNRLTPEQIARMIREAEAFKKDDKMAVERAKALNDLEETLSKLRIKSRSETNGGKCTQLVHDTVNWIETHRSATVRDFMAKTAELSAAL